MKKTIIISFFFIIFCLAAGLTVGWFWSQQDLFVWNKGVSTISGDAQVVILDELIPTPPATASATLNTYFKPGQPLQWKLITASATTPVPQDILAFRQDGQAATYFLRGEHYYIADRYAYQTFEPQSLDDLAKLQLPNLPLTPVAKSGAWIQAASTWYVPQSTPNLTYVVDYWDQKNVPPGTAVKDFFSVWFITDPA